MIVEHPTLGELEFPATADPGCWGGEGTRQRERVEVKRTS